MKHRSLGSDLLTVSAQELLQTLQDDKSSKINHEKTSPIFWMSAQNLTLDSGASEWDVISSAKWLIAGLAYDVIRPASFTQPMDCNFSNHLLILVAAFNKLRDLEKKLYYAAESWEQAVAIDSLEQLQKIVHDHRDQTMMTDLRTDELIFGFVQK